MSFIILTNEEYLDIINRIETLEDKILQSDDDSDIITDDTDLFDSESEE